MSHNLNHCKSLPCFIPPHLHFLLSSHAQSQSIAQNHNNQAKKLTTPPHLPPDCFLNNQAQKVSTVDSSTPPPPRLFLCTQAQKLSTLSPPPPLPRLCLSNQAQKLSTPGSKTYAAPWFRNFLVQISIFDQMPKPTLSQNIVQKISKFGHLPRRDMKPFWLKPSFHFLPPPFLYRKETSFSLLYNRQ